MALPLEGVVVADLTQNIGGPFCMQILGDMDADVVKIERPGRGDDARAWAPPYWGDESATFMAMNRNKRSIAIDMKREGGLEIVRRLVTRADVLCPNCHAELDYGVAAISLSALRHCDGHAIIPKYVEYHNREIHRTKSV